jgi:hypothetical protein
MGRKKYTQPYKDLDKLLRDAGFTHRFTGTGHHQYKPPPGSGMSIVDHPGLAPLAAEHRGRRPPGHED